MYSKQLLALLKGAGANEGDSVVLKCSRGSFEGILLPRISEGDSNTLTLKLNNGYNAGFAFEESMRLEKLGDAPANLASLPKLASSHTDLPAISVVGTGGTIGTHLDYRTGGVYMSRTPEEILAAVPELLGFVNVKSVSSPFTIASEDLQVWHWKELAREVARQVNSDAQGVVVTHGTDTLSYTSAVLSFMLKDLSKPVALVGAQRSPDRASFDGALNIVCGARYALSDIAEVAVVMHASSSDDYCYAHRGTKVRKMHTSRRDAFKSINASPLARIYPAGKLEMLSEARQRSDKKTVADTAFEEKVAILKIYPNSNPELLDFLVEKKYKGVVLEATAFGHVPTGESGTDAGKFDKKLVWLPHVKAAVDSGVVVAITSQSLYGSVNAFVYRNLRLLAETGAVFCRDMLPETAFVKLGWALGHEKKREKAEELLLTNVAGEFNDRITPYDY